MRTALTGQLEADPESVDPESVVPSVLAEVRTNGGQDSLPFTGQSAALVHDVAPATEIVSRLVAETEAALGSARSAT